MTIIKLKVSLFNFCFPLFFCCCCCCCIHIWIDFLSSLSKYYYYIAFWMKNINEWEEDRAHFLISKLFLSLNFFSFSPSKLILMMRVN